MSDGQVLAAHRAAFRAARRRGLPREDCLEIAQEVAARALLVAGGVGPAWGTTAAWGVLVDRWRHVRVEAAGRPRAARAAAQGAGVLEDLVAAEDVAGRAELVARVPEALGDLPPAPRAVLELELLGLGRIQAAERLGITPEAARMRAHRGRRILERLLG
ncbi:MAG: hypothetical protein DRH08_07325 [Deltaproteobacteria bacterium]|nr:MAG: hypothetical protein DRH08_07325 [Deltaproteobacteria bacterium]